MVHFKCLPTYILLSHIIYHLSLFDFNNRDTNNFIILISIKNEKFDEIILKRKKMGELKTTDNCSCVS